MSYRATLRRQQALFKETSRTISDRARRANDSHSRKHSHLLAAGCEVENLYPPLREEQGAVRFFQDRRIVWWHCKELGDSTDSLPTRNLKSSQVSCVNFLLPLATMAGALESLIRFIDADVESIVAIPDGRRTSTVEFEWIGSGCSLEPCTEPVRGSKVTSADALIVGATARCLRAYLFEWKLGECCLRDQDKAAGQRGDARKRIYRDLYCKPDSSFKQEFLLEAWLYDPYYQLMRLCLLRDEMIRRNIYEVQEAKVVLVCPGENKDYLTSMTSPIMRKRLPNAKAITDVMQATLRQPETFVVLSQADLIAHVRDTVADPALGDWSNYHRERYGW